MKETSAQVQVTDTFKPYPEYCLDPLEITAIGLYLGPQKMDKARLKAQERGLREFCIVGNASVRVQCFPPLDMRPPEPWLHEFVKPKYLAEAKKYVTEEVAREVAGQRFK